MPIYSIIAGAAIKAGVVEADLPSISDMAGYRARLLGTPDFYKLRAPPLTEPIELLRRLWPIARDILAQPPQKKFLRATEKPLKEIHWPILMSIVGSQFIDMTKAVLSPRISAALVMEAAIITSKIDPEGIDPGKWRIDEKGITRLRK